MSLSEWLACFIYPKSKDKIYYLFTSIEEGVCVVFEFNFGCFNNDNFNKKHNLNYIPKTYHENESPLQIICKDVVLKIINFL